MVDPTKKLFEFSHRGVSEEGYTRLVNYYDEREEESDDFLSLEEITRMDEHTYHIYFIDEEVEA